MQALSSGGKDIVGERSTNEYSLDEAVWINATLEQVSASSAKRGLLFGRTSARTSRNPSS